MEGGGWRVEGGGVGEVDRVPIPVMSIQGRKLF